MKICLHDGREIPVSVQEYIWLLVVPLVPISDLLKGSNIQHGSNMEDGESVSVIE